MVYPIDFIVEAIQIPPPNLHGIRIYNKAYMGMVGKEGTEVGMSSLLVSTSFNVCLDLGG